VTDKARNVVILRGGPFDGASLAIEHAEHNVTEVIFRVTDYFPTSPREFLYRSHTLENLSVDSVAKTLQTGVREWTFRSAEQSQMMERIQAQDRDIKRLDGEVNRLLAELERLKARLARKRKS
jgi:hypothetical protein